MGLSQMYNPSLARSCGARGVVGRGCARCYSYATPTGLELMYNPSLARSCGARGVVGGDFEFEN